MFEITEQSIELKDLTDAVADSKAGAIATFIGTTREHNRGRNVCSRSEKLNRTRWNFSRVRRYFCADQVIQTIGPDRYPG